MEGAADRDASRVDFLDGLRGWAAISVVIYHITWATFGNYTPEVEASYLSVLNDGLMAVYMFFIISGYALSFGFLRSGNVQRLQRMALARYPRLVIPIAAVSILAYTALKLHIFQNVQADTIIGSDHFLGYLYAIHPSIGSLAAFIAWDVFFSFPRDVNYGPFLWTMPIELVSSFVLFAVLAATGKRGVLVKTLVYTMVVVVCWIEDLYFLLFMYGLILADLQPQFVKANGQVRNVLGIALFVAGCAGSSLMRFTYTHHRLGLVALCLVSGCALSPVVQEFFRNKLSRFFGKISFPIYLVHGLVICSIGSWLILEFAPKLDRWPLVTLVSVVTFAAAILAARLFVPVERVAVHVSHKVASVLSPSNLLTSDLIRRRRDHFPGLRSHARRPVAAFEHPPVRVGDEPRH